MPNPAVGSWNYDGGGGFIPPDLLQPSDPSEEHQWVTFVLETPGDEPDISSHREDITRVLSDRGPQLLGDVGQPSQPTGDLPGFALKIRMLQIERSVAEAAARRATRMRRLREAIQHRDRAVRIAAIVENLERRQEVALRRPIDAKAGRIRSLTIRKAAAQEALIDAVKNRRWDLVRTNIGLNAKLAAFLERVRQGESVEDEAVNPLDHEISRLFVLPDDADSSVVAAYNDQGLGRFYKLRLSMTHGELEKQYGIAANGRLFDLKYALQGATRLESVAVDIPYDGLSERPTSAAGWHLESIEATRWAGADGSNATIPAGIDGSGVVIAHPDTGWTLHTELDLEALDLEKQLNVLAPHRTAEEPVTYTTVGETVASMHHGTATGSVIVSGDRPGDTSSQDVIGIAPGAKLIPIRCASWVVLVSGVAVATAIFYASIRKADIISISLGGIGSRYLQVATKFAIANQVIPISAAGNVSPLVVCPALYPETIGCASVDNADVPMSKANAEFITSQGCAVDISAPGAGVNRAYWNGTAAVTGPSDGTSYSTALTAGAAALWLQKHGKHNLVSQLRPGETLLDVFRAHVTSSARAPIVWDSRRMGAGILNLPGLLDPAGISAHFASPPNPLRLSLLQPIMTAEMAIVRMLCPVVPSKDQVEKMIVGIFGQEAWDRIEEFGEEIIALVQTSEEMIVEAFQALRDYIAEWLNDLLDKISEMVGAVYDAARSAINNALNKINEGVVALNAIVEDVIETLLQLGTGVAQALDIDSAVDTVTEAIGKAAEVIEESLKKVGEAVSGVLRAVW